MANRDVGELVVWAFLAGMSVVVFIVILADLFSSNRNRK